MTWTVYIENERMEFEDLKRVAGSYEKIESNFLDKILKVWTENTMLYKRGFLTKVIHPSGKETDKRLFLVIVYTTTLEFEKATPGFLIRKKKLKLSLSSKFSYEIVGVSKNIADLLPVQPKAVFTFLDGVRFPHLVTQALFFTAEK
ncbi:MAG: hypothetical protein ACFFBD_27110 [Candidatus Hodarchaeota archaeon]